MIAETPEDQVIELEHKQNIHKAVEVSLNSLDDRQRRIIKQTIMSDNPASRNELGKELKISRERVRQLENAALKKIAPNFKEVA